MGETGVQQRGTRLEAGAHRSRPRLSTRLVVVWVLFAVLLAGIVALEGARWLNPPAPTADARPALFTFTEPELGAVEFLYRGQQASLMRDAAGQWFRHDGSHAHSRGDAVPGEVHRADAGAAGEIADALAVSVRMRADRYMQPDRSLSEYGLENPQALVAFYGRKGTAADFARPLAVLYVGDLLTTEFSYYTLLDGAQQIALLPRYQVSLLLALAFGKETVPTPVPESPPAQ